MFQPRSRDFDPHITAIVKHLRAIEKELAEIGGKAAAQGSPGGAAIGYRTVAAFGPVLGEFADRFRQARRAATDGAANLGSDAFEAATRAGSRALASLANRTRQRPVLTLGLAVGAGILLAAAFRRS